MTLTIVSQLEHWLGWGQQPPQGTGQAVATGMWLGILFGWLEAVQHLIFLDSPRILAIAKVTSAVFWVAPLLMALLLGVVALLGSLPRLVLRGWPSVALATLAGTAMGVFGLVTLTKKVHNGGAAILALGVAVVAWRVLRRPAAAQFVRRTLPVMAAALLLIWMGLGAAKWWQERLWMAQLAAPPPNTPNVLIVVLDTVRADHLSVDGYFRQTTPHIDRWATEGTVFDSAWSNTSWTLPAHATMLSGLPTYEHGADHQGKMDRGVPILPEFLAKRGYLTGLFAANFNWLIPTYGFDRGMLRLKAQTPYSVAADTSWGRKLYASLTLWLKVKQTPVRKNAAKVNAEFLEWLDQYPGRPFFAMLNYFDAHSPYDAPPPYDKKFTGDTPNLPEECKPFQDEVNRYDGLIAYIDDQMQALRDELDRRGLAQNTIVLITSDHGEGFGEHGSPEHTRELHSSVLRVPMILIAPSRVAKGERVKTAVSVQQFPATIMELLGIPGHPFPGETMTRWVGKEGDGDTEPLLAELKSYDQRILSKSLVTTRWQYIWNATDGTEELYDLEKDPREIHDLAEPEVTTASEEIEEVLDEFRARLAQIFPDLPIPGK